MDHMELLASRRKKLAVVGLGYVGLPLAASFSEHFSVIGYDCSREKIEQYQAGRDVTREIGDERLARCSVEFTADPVLLKEACFVVVAVPTPVNADKTPDLKPLLEASRTIGQFLSPGAIVVYESTVYPGVTEELCASEIEKASGLRCGEDFSIGYSPERINPGDRVHTLQNITKIVSGLNEETLEQIAAVYSTVVQQVYRAESIQVAEAAKLAENAQRDVNIAFMNELSMAFCRMGINTMEVLQAMNTKWNALRFYPGLVGGHCIGVDPYYFVYDAEQFGYHSSIIADGRKINDDMPQFVAGNIVKKLMESGKNPLQCKIYLLGMTFKGNCPDTRNSKSGILLRELESYGLNVEICDPWVSPAVLEREFKKIPVPLEAIGEADCLIFAAEHREFSGLMPEDVDGMLAPEGSRLVADIRNIFHRKSLEEKAIRYWSL